MRRIPDDETLSRLHARGEGYIYNDFAGQGPSGEKYNVLHRASCHWNGRSNTNAPKVFFENLDEAVAWLNQNRGAEHRSWKRCGTCRPSGASARSVVTAAPTVTYHPSEIAPDAGAHEHFLVRRSDQGSMPVVEAWSEDRLPFEPRGWSKTFRNALREMIGALEAQTDQVLHAVYGSAVHGDFDIENVLFYNVGPAYISGAGRYGLRFERRYEAPPPPQTKPWPLRHYHRYALTTHRGRFVHWQDGPLVGRWEFAISDVKQLFDCATVWLALKNSGSVQVGHQNMTDPLLMRVAVGVPHIEGTYPVAATSLIKPLVDGITSAFHVHQGPDQQEFTRRVAHRTGTEPTVIDQFLRQQRHAVLGPRRLLRRFRDGVQWNPADDRFVAVELQVRALPKLSTFTIRGEMRVAQQASS